MQRKTTAYLAVNIFYWSVLVILTGLLVTKAFFLPVTNDEAYSFFLVKTHYWKAMAGTANTHWLNSFFVGVFTFLGGDAPGYWRMQSVMAGAGYIFIAKKVAGNFESAVMQLICFSLLVFNPYLLDYFSMARGYGSAAFFTLLSVYYLQQFMEKGKEVSFFYCFLSLSAAVVSNYTTLYFLLSSFLLLTFFLFRYKGGFVKGLFKKGIYTKIWLLSVSIIIIAAGNLFFIKYYTHDLEFGATHSFARDSFGSLLQYSSFLFMNDQSASAAGYILFFVILLLSFLTFRQAVNSKPKAATWIAAVMLLAILISNIFFYLLKTPFPVERGVLVFYPLVVLILCYGSTLWHTSFGKQSTTFLLGSLSFLFVINTAFHFKHNSTLDWKENANTPAMLETVEKMSGKKGALKVGMHRLHYGVYKNYYSLVNDQFRNWDVIFFSDEELAHPDQTVFNKLDKLDFLLSTEKTNSVLFNDDSSKYILVQQFSSAGDMLLRRKIHQ